MRYVEQPGRFAHPQMLGHDALILHRHLISGERNHAATLGPVPRIERQQLVLDFGAIFPGAIIIVAHRSVSVARCNEHDDAYAPSSAAPSVTEPESFDHAETAWLTPSVAPAVAAALSRVSLALRGPFA